MIYSFSNVVVRCSYNSIGHEGMSSLQEAGRKRMDKFGRSAPLYIYLTHNETFLEFKREYYKENPYEVLPSETPWYLRRSALFNKENRYPQPIKKLKL